MGQIGFDPQNIQDLCTAVAQVKGVVEATADEVKKFIDTIVSEEVFADCEYKDSILETRARLGNAFESIATILTNVESKVDAVGEKVGVNVKKNMMSVEDQNALIEAAMKKTQQ